ncbi:MAG TPA: NAD(P)H-hydrate dehydratase [Terriglobia bacterium]|nr:NAD(P)H-hydrate dehydratase [Terriglobia bacterium]
MKILTPEQLREVDRLSTEKYGIPNLILMENAGMRVAEVLEDQFENLDQFMVAILCGRGNNGGDGLVVARQLIQKGCFPFVFLFAPEEEVKGDAKTNLNILKALGYPPTVVLNEHDWNEEKLELLDADIVVDALLGTGARKPVEGLYRTVIGSIAEDFPSASVVAVDVPSPGVRADITVTFSALKPSLVLYPDCEEAGDVILADIGNPPELLENENYWLHLIEPHEPPSRVADSNKGMYGKVLVIGGSRGKAGAAAMAGQAALRSGAGLVTVATAASAQPIIAISMPELMTAALAETSEGTIANQSMAAHLKDKTIVAIGPGLTTVSETSAFVRRLGSECRSQMVIDADGLNALVGFEGDLGGAVLTPHPGEMARLIGKSIEHVTSNRIDVAKDFAKTRNAYVVLKGHRTVVAAPNGSIYINPTGNPGMATGGTGDILTGMIAGILAQEHLGTFIERLCLSVYLHGLAGDFAAEELGEESLVATDLLRFLPKAWENLRDDFPVRRTNLRGR